MRNAGIINYALFWNGNNGLQCAYFANNCLQSASVNRRFLNNIKWYKFYNNNLLVVLGRKKEGTLKLVNLKHEEWVSIQLLSLSVLTFLLTLLICQVIFQWKKKQNKTKGNSLKRNALNVSRKFCVNLLGKWEIFVNFPRGFWTVKVTHFAQVINFAKGSTGKFFHTR